MNMDESRQTSVFRIYSIGVVANIRERNSEYIEVTPLEQLPMLDGELTQAVNNYEARSSDASGAHYEEVVNVTATITAKWLPIGHSNRQTPPDVRRGEYVVIYQFADSDEYFWETYSNQTGLRRLETVVQAYSGTKDETTTQLTPENAYVFTVSTHDGKIQITTSKTNAEPYSYDILLDTANGNFTLKDDIGNNIHLDSKDALLRLQNSKGSILQIKGEEGLWKTNKSIKMETKQMEIKTTTIKVIGERTHMGNSTHMGNVALMGGLSSSAYGGSDGSATFSGGIKCTKDVTAGGISLMNHVHVNSGGSGDSGRPK